MSAAGTVQPPARPGDAGAPAALPTSPRARRRVTVRHVLGVLLLLGGVVGTVWVIRQADTRTPVLVTTRAIAPGQIISPDDVRTLELGLSPGAAAATPADRDRIIGHVAAGPLPAGQILTPDLAAEAPALADGEVAMSLPVGPARAVGGLLQVGQQVRVLARTPSGEVIVAAETARVLAIAESDVGLAETAGVTVAVPADHAPQLAAAGDQVDLLLLPPPPAGQGEGVG